MLIFVIIEIFRENSCRNYIPTNSEILSKTFCGPLSQVIQKLTGTSSSLAFSVKRTQFINDHTLNYRTEAVLDHFQLSNSSTYNLDYEHQP